MERLKISENCEEESFDEVDSTNSQFVSRVFHFSSQYGYYNANKMAYKVILSASHAIFDNANKLKGPKCGGTAANFPQVLRSH